MILREVSRRYKDSMKATDLNEKSYIVIMNRIKYRIVIMSNGILAFHANLNLLKPKPYSRYSQVLDQGYWTT